MKPKNQPPQEPSPRQPPPTEGSAPESGESLPASDALKELAAEADGLGRPPAGEGAAPGVEPPAAPAVSTGKLLEGVLLPMFAIVAPNWNVTPAEVSQLSQSYGLLLDEYFPGGLNDYGPELGALLVTVAVFGPRMNTPRKLPPPPKPETKDTAPAAANA